MKKPIGIKLTIAPKTADRIVRDISRVAIVGLGLIVGVAVVSGVNDKKVEIEKMRLENGYELRVKNVIRGPEPETFYFIGDKRYFTKIDGEPIEEYFLK